MRRIFLLLIGAAVVWVFYRLVLLLGYGNRVAILLSAVLAVGTMHFHYSIISVTYIIVLYLNSIFSDCLYL